MTAADRPSVTDDARAEAERRWPHDDYRDPLMRGAMREKQHAFVAGAEWAAARAETTTATIEDAEEALHGAGWFARADLDPRDLRGILHDLADADLHATTRAETTTATTEDAVGELLERMSNVVTRLEALRDEHWYAPERQRLRGKVEGVKLAASYVEEARGLLATARTVNVHPTYTVEYQQKIADELGVEREAVLRALGLAAPLLATARTLPTRDDLARAIASGYEPDHPTPNRHDYRAADAVLALLRGGERRG